MQRVWRQPMNSRRLVPAAVLAVVAAIAVSVGIRQAGELWLHVASGQAILSTTAIVVTTLAAAVLATLLLAFLGHTQARPFSAFRRFAMIAFVVSCLGPVLARLGWLPGLPQVDGNTFLVLMLMNAATTIVLVAFLTTVPRGRERSIGF